MIALSRAVICAVAALPAVSASATTPSVPSDRAIRQNAFQIFNAVHSALRQWGASIHHNGMSLFVVTVPEGQPLYHGGRVPNRKEGFDWLAFELEHAQIFARSNLGRWGTADGSPPQTPAGLREVEDLWEEKRPTYFASAVPDPGLANGDQKPMGDRNRVHRPPGFWGPGRGYFHTYRAARPLNLLYLDGMSAGMGYGTLDMQDYVLLNWSVLNDGTRFPDKRTDMNRANELCDLAADWAWDGGRIDGFVRTEVGFEVIYCHFEDGDGLDLASIHASPFSNETGSALSRDVIFECARAVSERYHGFPSGRAEVDWSSMVSALFYDMNVTNPDASRPELPRVVDATLGDRMALRAKVQEVVAARHGKSSVVDWQGVVDLVVTRYSHRLPLLAQASFSTAVSLVNGLLNPYIDYIEPNPTGPLLDRCTYHFLQPTLLHRSSWTSADASIYTAIETVSGAICSTFVHLREILNNEVSSQDEVVGETHRAAHELMEKLRWTTWKDCGKCPSPDQICFVAMFPLGSPEDHFNPSCKNSTLVNNGRNYWRPQRPVPADTGISSNAARLEV